MPTNRDHPQFIANCETVRREGSCAYTTPGQRAVTYQLMLPTPDGGITTFVGMPFSDPARALGRIRGWLYNKRLSGPWGVAA